MEVSSSSSIGAAPGERDFCWIQDDLSLKDFCNGVELVVGERPPVYIDTEADSLHHYQEKLCLIQVAIKGKHALIDPLAIKDMSPLLALFDRCNLWLHSADYDLTLLKRAYGWMPKAFYDTQIASRLAGHRAFGLAALVLHYTGVKLCKSSQKEDWSRRPLTEKMMAYAIDDVRYLPVLSGKLLAELSSSGRMEWFLESCENLREEVLSRQIRDKEEAWRIAGAGKLRPAGLAFLRDVWRWRDEMACERDVPPFRILNNQQMLTMAGEWEQYSKVSIPPRWKGRWRASFEDVLEDLQKSDPKTWPERPKKFQRRSTEEERGRVEQLCKARDAIAQELDIESSLLGSRAVMEDLVLNQSDPREKLMRWQISVLGEEVLAVARGVSAAGNR